MEKNLIIETQGIDKSEFRANGDYDNTEWGKMTADELLSFLQKVESLKELDYSGDEDFCVPNVLVENPDINLSGANLSFSLNEGEFLFVDIDNDYQCKVTPSEAVALSTGEKTGAEMVQTKGPAFESASTGANQPAYASSGTGQTQQMVNSPVRKSRGPIKKLAIVVGIAIAAIGLLAMIGGEPGGGFIFIIIGTLPAIWGFKKPSSTPFDRDEARGIIQGQNFAREMNDNQDEDHDADYSGNDVDVD